MGELNSFAALPLIDVKTKLYMVQGDKYACMYSEHNSKAYSG